MKKVKVEEHTNNIVSKANELIKAKGALSGTAQKMLCSIVSMIRVNDKELQEYALKIDDYLKLINSNSKNMDFIKEKAKELMNNPFEIDSKIFNWCSMVDLKRIDGYIVFDIHPKLKPYLLELKDRGNFTQYKIINILSLKGEYSPRFYEFLTMEYNQYIAYHKSSKSFTLEIKIDYLREMFKIPKTYRYHDIKRQILDKAQKQFKEKTDIQFNYQEEKLGRKVDRLIIKVQQNNQGSNNHLRNRQSFINYIRKNFVNKTLVESIDKNTKAILMLSVAPNGHLYNKYSLDKIPSNRSDEMWNTLFELAKAGRLKLEDFQDDDE
jgi:plasmid replication initiation protein